MEKDSALYQLMDAGQRGALFSGFGSPVLRLRLPGLPPSALTAVGFGFLPLCTDAASFPLNFRSRKGLPEEPFPAAMYLFYSCSGSASAAALAAVSAFSS